MEEAIAALVTRLTARMANLGFCLPIALVSVDAFSDGCLAGKSKITTFEGKVDINRATERDLLEIPRVGVKTARAIVDYRRANGEFKSMRQLYRVRGVGDGTMMIECVFERAILPSE